jgi:capsular polysaccharide biosynthesis protein
VIARFLETFFRHKLLILLPAIITPLVVVPFAFVLVKPYYETWAGLWVERPAYVPSTDDWNRYVTPAQNQQQRLTELLKTRSFTEEVARKTSLGPLLESPQGRDEVYEYLQRAIAPLATGNKLLNIRVRTEDPDLSMEVINATVTTFRERNQNERMVAASQAISFYEQQLRDAEERLVSSRESVRRYAVANPRAVTEPAGSVPRSLLPTAATDPQLAEILKRLEGDETEVERLRGLVTQAKFEATATLEGTDSSLQVIDQPIYPTRAQRERRRLLIFPAAAVAIGTLVSALLLVGLAASDRSVRSTADLRSMSRVIGVVPRMGLRRMPRQAGPETTRRAIAFVAGTAIAALPAPRKAG